MTNRERVMAALRGEPVDRVPLAFWMHNFVAENSVKEFVAESLRLAREFGWDYLKPQSRAQCFAEAWGLRYQASGDRAVQYTRTHAPCADAAALRRLAPADPAAGALGQQLDALRQIRAGVERPARVVGERVRDGAQRDHERGGLLAGDRQGLVGAARQQVRHHHHR